MHWSAPPSSIPPRRQRSPIAGLASRGVNGSISLLPPARIRARNSVSESLRASFQVPFFHRSEIMAIDIGKPGKAAKSRRNRRFYPARRRSGTRESRESQCFFPGLKTQRAAGCPAARSIVPKWRSDQPSEATRLDRREILREAVFLWMTPRATPRNSSGCAFCSASAA